VSAATVALRITDDLDLAVEIERHLKGLTDDECEDVLHRVDDSRIVLNGKIAPDFLLRAVDAARDTVVDLRPQTEVRDEPVPDANPISRWTPLDFEAIERDGIPAVDWIFPGWIVAKDIFLLGGDAGVGKSTLLSRMAYAATSGGEWCGIAVTRPLRVLYIDEEESDREAYHLFRRHGPILPADRLRVFVEQGLNLDSDQGLALMEREVGAFRPDLVLIDSATAAFGTADGNKNTEVGLVYGRLRQLRKTYGVTIGLNHHLGKPGETKRTLLHRILGSVAYGTQSSAVFGAVSHDADSLELVAVKRRGVPKPWPTMVVGYREEGGLCYLENRGPVEETDSATIACSEWAISHLEERGRPIERAQIVEAAKRLSKPFKDDVVDKSLKHAVSLGLVHKPRRGWYAIGRAPLTLLEKGAGHD